MTNVLSKCHAISVLLVCAAVLSGCKEVLYSDLQENEANEMVAVLASEGIASSRARDKNGIYQISVETVDIPAAVTLLRAANLPGEKFMSFGDVFSAEGIISTPFEQHARYVYALNQELSSTLTGLDHIQSARVLISSPPQGRYDRTPPPATASVTIEYAQGFDLTPQISAIKSIVAHSVPNLDYDDVAVALFEAVGPRVEALAPTDRPDISAAGFLTQIGAVSGLWRQLIVLLGLGSFCLILVLLFRRGRPASDPS